MRTTLRAALLPLAFATAAFAAEDRYDRMIEQAAMDIVAAKLGELRGGFAADRQPEFVAPIGPAAPAAPAVSAARPGEWRDGLALAEEHPPAIRSTF
jgi:hypothetical protein